MYDSITNYINAKGLKSRKSGKLVRRFKENYSDLKQKGFIVRLVKLDNEISKEMIQIFEKHKLDYQLVVPGDHRLIPAERTIQTFKNHFIAIRSGMKFSLPKQV